MRRRRWLEETIFLVGTPQCLVAEGLADLAVEVAFGARPRAGRGRAPPAPRRALRRRGGGPGAPGRRGARLGAVQRRLIGLHDGGWPVDDVVAYLERWSLLPHERAAKATSFLTDPTWRAYGHCYAEGLRCAGARWPATPTGSSGWSPTSSSPPTWPRRGRRAREVVRAALAIYRRHFVTLAGMSLVVFRCW